MFVLLLSVGSPAVAAAADEAEARPLATEAYEEFQRGNYPEALALFERAHKAQPSPRLLRAIAKCLFELRRYSEAIVACDGALTADADALGEGLRADVRELRERALGFTGTARLIVDPPSAEVTVDGRPLRVRGERGEVRVDVGRHTIDASAPGRQSVRRELAIDAGASTELRIVLVAPGAVEQPPASRAGSYALVGALGLVGAAGVVGSTLWFIDRSRAVDLCNDAAVRGALCDNGSGIATQRDLSTVGIIASATLFAGAAVGLVWIARSGSARKGSTASNMLVHGLAW